jgi:hypothetical protein
MYAIYNYYCSSSASPGAVIELALQAPMPCSTSRIASQTTSKACDYVEAFIDTMTTSLSDIKPVFYRCYWYSPTPSATSFETVEFEWSATAEYIIWYINNINGNGNSVNDIMQSLGFPAATGFYVPLLKVTNHSPYSY